MLLSSRTRRDLLVLLAYLALALVLTCPLILEFTTHVAGDRSDAPALAWNLWWVPHALLDLGRSPIYTDYIFYPIGANLAFYTLTYLNAFLAIPFQFAFGLVPAANLILLLSFTLSGYGAYLLAQQLLRRESSTWPAAAAFAAGLLYAFSSNKLLYASLGQFNIASSQWIPFYVLFLVKLMPPTLTATSGTRGTALRYGFLLGLFLLFQALSEFIFASFLILFSLAYLLYWLVLPYGIRARRTPDRPRLAHVILGLAVGAATFTLPMLPILAAMVTDLRTEGDFLQSGLGFSNTFSADLLGFFVPSRLNPLLGGLDSRFHFAYINFVYLGYVALALAFIALWRARRARLWGFWFAIILLISLGPSLRVDGREIRAAWLPFNLLLRLPFFEGNRYPSRWSVMLTLCLAVLVGYGLTVLLRSRWAGRHPGIRWQIGQRNLLVSSSVLISSLLSILLVGEHLSIPLPTVDLRVPEVYETIARQPGDFSVMELPLAWRNGFRVTGSYRAGSQGAIDPVFMLAQWYQTVHRRPILNGNTSRNPELEFQYFAETPVLESLVAIQAGHTIPAEIQERDRALAPDLLKFLGIRYLIWHAPALDANREVANRTRAYVEAVFPATKISETYEAGRGLVVYQVPSLLPADSLALRPGDALARLYLGEGWGAVGGSAFVVTRTEARLWLPVSSAHELSLQLHGVVAPEGQTLRLWSNGQPAGPAMQLAAGKHDYALTVPASVLRPGLNELSLLFGRTVELAQVEAVFEPVAFPIGSTGVSSPVSLVVRSAGEEQGAFGHIFVNGGEASPGGRGYNLVVVNPETGAVEARENFDTFGSSTESQNLAEWMDGIPDGRIVLAAASDEASYHLTAAGAEALLLIGASEELVDKFRWSHAVIGVKGAAPGTALETASEIAVSQLIVGAPATEPTVAIQVDSISAELQK